MKQRKQIIFYQGVPIWLSTEKKLNKLANKTGTPMHHLIGHILDITIDMIAINETAICSKTKKI